MRGKVFKLISLILIVALLASIVGIAEDSDIELDAAPQASDEALDIVTVEDVSLDDIGLDDDLLLTDITLADQEMVFESDGPAEAGGITAEPEDDTVEPADISENAVKKKYGVPISATLGIKETLSLQCTKTNLTYKSSAIKIAKVDEKGVITAVKKGKATITVYSNSKKLTTCKVTVVAAPQKVSLGMKRVNLGVKEKLTLIPSITKGSHASFTYRSANEKIASVTGDGKVTGKKVGSTTITVTTQNKKKAKLTVSVMKAPGKVTVKPKSVEMEEGQTYLLVATLPNKTASNQLKWTSSNKKIAMVDGNGVVTAVKAGTVKITVTTFNKKKAVCTVKINKPFAPSSSLEALEFFSREGTSIEAVGRVTGKHDLIPLTGKETDEEKKLIQDANKAAKQVNKQIDACNETYDELCSDLKNFGEEFANNATASETESFITYSMADLKLVVDKAAMELIQSGNDCTLEDVTDDGVIKVLCGNSAYYMTMTEDAIYITTTMPNAAIRNASKRLSSNTSISESYQYFKEKATWISAAVTAINEMIRKAIEKYDNLIKGEKAFLEKAAEIDGWNKLDTYKDIQKAAQKNINHYEGCKAFFKGLSAGLSAINIGAEVASLFDIADKWGQVISIDLHAHPTSKDIEDGKESMAKQLNTQIKWAYGFFLSNAMLSMMSIGGVIASVSTAVASAFGGVLAPIAAGGITITLAMITSSIALSVTTNILYGNVVETDQKLHEPTPTPTPTPTSEPPATPQPGQDTIFFGHYEQDNDPSNGTEPIEWTVLKRDGNLVMLISKKGLDCKQYHTQLESVTWATCALRSWLNSSFLNTAFSADEQAKIQTTSNINNDNPRHGTAGGNDTQDKVYCLSTDEYSEYTSSHVICYPTEYAVAHGVSTEPSGVCYWWLRSPGFESWYAAAAAGFLYEGLYVNFENVSIRPVIVVNLS